MSVNSIFISAAFSVFIIAYVGVSFHQAEKNPKEWEVFAREVFFSIFLACELCLLIAWLITWVVIKTGA